MMAKNCSLTMSSSMHHECSVHRCFLFLNQLQRSSVKCLLSQRVFNTNAGLFFNQLVRMSSISSLWKGFVIELISNDLYAFYSYVVIKKQRVWDKKPFNMMLIGRLKHANWMVKACILEDKSIHIAHLLHVNRVQEAEFKTLKAFKISPFCLFSDFVLSKKKNRFNKRKVC